MTFLFLASICVVSRSISVCNFTCAQCVHVHARWHTHTHTHINGARMPKESDVGTEHVETWADCYIWCCLTFHRKIYLIKWYIRSLCDVPSSANFTFANKNANIQHTIAVHEKHREMSKFIAYFGRTFFISTRLARILSWIQMILWLHEKCSLAHSFSQSRRFVRLLLYILFLFCGIVKTCSSIEIYYQSQTCWSFQLFVHTNTKLPDLKLPRELWNRIYMPFVYYMKCTIFWFCSMIFITLFTQVISVLSNRWRDRRE